MDTKERMLELFEHHRGIYFSGEMIAEKLNVSRTAVWKAVKNLQKEGYRIDAVRNKGYCLSEETDILSEQGIGKYLKPVCEEIQIHVEESVDSTNTLVRKQAELGTAEGYTLIANRQTSGRGRRGRTFYSPADTGIYLSILLRPKQFTAQQAVRLTTIAAVAACEALERVSGKKAEIKWVNDVFMNGKKVCGILTEASFGLEDGFLEYAVLGIGMNVCPPKEGFPEELTEIAGTVFEEAQNDGKNKLAAEFLNRFMEYYRAPKHGDYQTEYRKRSFVIGKEIEVISGGKSEWARALDVDDQCQLLVEDSEGKRKLLSSGEISVRISK